MKKLIVGVLIFTMVAVTTTGLLINKKNNSSPNYSINNEQDQDLDNPNHDEPNESKEETIDLYGTYDENDLEIEEIDLKVDKVNETVKIPHIKGLKNKDVENKINEDIKSKVLQKIEENYVENFSDFWCSCDVSANFANVLSISFSIGYTSDGKYFGNSYGLNYELLNGENLKFADLFTKDADVYSIVRRLYYKELAKEENCPYMTIDGEDRYIYDIHFDKEKNTWVGKYDIYNFETEQTRTVETEYIPRLIEDEINEKVMEFINNGEDRFYFTPAAFKIKYTGLDFKDMADQVVIYNKYLTDESIYERSGIGRKNIWTCAVSFDNQQEYADYGFAEDNFYYDIAVSEGMYYDGKYYFSKSKDKLVEELVALLKEEVEEYRKIAKENPDKFYVLFDRGSVYQDIYGERKNNLIFRSREKHFAHSDIASKKEIIDRLLESYRYYNLGFYQDVLEYEVRYLLRESELFAEHTENEELKVYDARNLKEITSIGEIFKEGTNYLEILGEILKYRIIKYHSDVDIEKINEYLNNVTYKLSINDIQCVIPELDRDVYIYFDELDSSILKVYDFDLLEGSNTRKIEKREIQDLSLDELNNVYNEIFARHGHDFKDKNLKEYFEDFPWYEPEEGKTVSMEELNEFEKYNLSVIKDVIAEKKG